MYGFSVWTHLNKILILFQVTLCPISGASSTGPPSSSPGFYCPWCNPMLKRGSSTSSSSWDRPCTITSFIMPRSLYWPWLCWCTLWSNSLIYSTCEYPLLSINLPFFKDFVPCDQTSWYIQHVSPLTLLLSRHVRWEQCGYHERIFSIPKYLESPTWSYLIMDEITSNIMGKIRHLFITQKSLIEGVGWKQNKWNLKI